MPGDEDAASADGDGAPADDDGAPADDDGAPADGDATPAGDDRGPVVRPAVKSSMLWGLVGGLSFLVLVQGYELVADLGVGFGPKLVVALLVAVGSALLTYSARGRLPIEDEGGS